MVKPWLTTGRALVDSWEASSQHPFGSLKPTSSNQRPFAARRLVLFVAARRDAKHTIKTSAVQQRDVDPPSHKSPQKSLQVGPKRSHQSQFNMGPRSLQGLCNPWLAIGRPLVGSWLALVGPTLGWTLTSLAQNWCIPWLATGRALVGSWLPGWPWSVPPLTGPWPISPNVGATPGWPLIGPWLGPGWSWSAHPRLDLGQSSTKAATTLG